MKKQLPQLGKLGTAFFSLAQTRLLKIVRLGDLQAPLRLTPDQEHQLLKRLTRNGFIVRLAPGKFLIPNKLPAGGFWQPNSNYLILKLMELYNAKYYVGGMSALQYYGLTTQIPNEITLFNDKVNAKKVIGSQTFNLIKIKSKKLAGRVAIDLKNAEGKIYIASLAQTVLDGVQYWKRFSTLPDAYDWIKQNSQNKDFVTQLVQLASQYSNIITIRRIGYYLESLGVSQSILKRLRKKLTAAQGWIVLDPNRSNQGKTNKQWRIIDNVEKLQTIN